MYSENEIYTLRNSRYLRDVIEIKYKSFSAMNYYFNYYFVAYVALPFCKLSQLKS